MKLILITSIISAAGQILLKSGMQRNGNFLINGFNLLELLKTVFSPLVLAGFLFYGVSSVLYLKLLSGSNLSSAYPLVVASTFIVLSFSSIILFSDSLNFYKTVGVIGIIAGIALIVRS